MQALALGYYFNSSCTYWSVSMSKSRYLKLFSDSVERLGIPKSSSVVIGVSGGSDSVALTHLARQVFKKVVSITVDHRLREESSEEARRTAEIVKKIGVDEHHTVTLDWGGQLPQTNVQQLARLKRYSAMLEICREKKIPTLMTAHHVDDQVETFLIRLFKSSKVEGLACMRAESRWPSFPETSLVRPLLDWNKESLVRVCEEGGYEWVEDPTNSGDVYHRSRVRKVISQNPHIKPGVIGLIDTCGLVKDKIRDIVSKVFSSSGYVRINRTYGYAYVDVAGMCSLDPPVAYRVLTLLMQFIRVTSKSLKYRHYQNIMKMFRNPYQARTATFMKCTIIPQHDNFLFARQEPEKQVLTPISVSETICWDRRFEISLHPLRDEHGDLIATKESKFYVRHLVNDGLAKFGVRKVCSYNLPVKHVRRSLPVIVDESGNVVIIPLFKFIDETAGVACECQYKPERNLEAVVKEYVTCNIIQTGKGLNYFRGVRVLS